MKQQRATARAERQIAQLIQDNEVCAEQPLCNPARLPIVPIGGGHPFWKVARKVLGRTGANILPELRGDQLLAANCWQALGRELYAASRPVSPFSFRPFPR